MPEGYDAPEMAQVSDGAYPAPVAQLLGCRWGAGGALATPIGIDGPEDFDPLPNSVVRLKVAMVLSSPKPARRPWWRPSARSSTSWTRPEVVGSWA